MSATATTWCTCSNHSLLLRYDWCGFCPSSVRSMPQSWNKGADTRSESSPQCDQTRHAFGPQHLWQFCPPLGLLQPGFDFPLLDLTRQDHMQACHTANGLMMLSGTTAAALAVGLSKLCLQSLLCKVIRSLQMRDNNVKDCRIISHI